MSKLFDMYINLKKQNKESVYLFKTGVFFISLHEDAYTLSNLFGFKLTNFSNNIVKCGFPQSSYSKYEKLFQALNLNIQIIDSSHNISYSLKTYSQSKKISELLHFINEIDTDTLSIQESYNTINTIKKLAYEVSKE